MNGLEILSRLHGVRVQGEGRWQAQCPAQAGQSAAGGEGQEP